MMQTAEDWSRSDNFVVRETVSVSSPRYRLRAGFGQARTEAAVRTVSIVVPDPLAQDASEMALVQRNHEIQAFPPNRSNEALTDRVR